MIKQCGERSQRYFKENYRQKLHIIFWCCNDLTVKLLIFSLEVLASDEN